MPLRAKGLTLEGKPSREREHDQKRASVKRGNVVVPASPVHKEKCETEPVAKAEAEAISDTMHFPLHRSPDGIGDTTLHSSSVRLWNAPGGEWPLTKRLKDKQALRALHVQLDRNAGSPSSREAQGEGVPTVPVGVTT
jgi:hypothetical protein